jgi:hypothetical protein
MVDSILSLLYSSLESVQMQLDAQQRMRAASGGKKSANSSEQLSTEERRLLAELKRIDSEVRAHERAHMAAGRELVRSVAAYSYERGPDGKLYAVGGEVNIDTSDESTPEKTITKADRIRAAALAPAEPSAQDRRVAARASNMKVQAQLELAREESLDSEQTAGSAAQQAYQAGQQQTLVNLFDIAA